MIVSCNSADATRGQFMKGMGDMNEWIQIFLGYHSVRNKAEVMDLMKCMECGGHFGKRIRRRFLL